MIICFVKDYSKTMYRRLFLLLMIKLERNVIRRGYLSELNNIYTSLSSVL